MIAMDKVHSIRQLFYEQGKSVSAIAAETGHDRKTISKLNILRWQSHPISRNRATGSVIESRSSDGGSHDLCRGSQYGDLAFDRSFPLPHGYFPVNPHGIGRWYDAVKDRIGKGTASQSFMPAFRHEL